MSVVLTRREVLDPNVRDELDQLVVSINERFGLEHDTDTGSHTDVTALSVETVTLDITDGSQTTVGAAGGASALPATPSGYQTIAINGVEYVVPYYAKS